MSQLYINGKKFEFSSSTMILVLDTNIELSSTPTTIYYQTSPGVQPSGLSANARYYNWKPGTLMTVIEGETGGNSYELYWFYNFKREAYMFDHADVPNLNQTLVKIFRYGSQDEVVFDSLPQQLSILALAGSTIQSVTQETLHHYQYCVFPGDSSVFLDTGYKMRSYDQVYCTIGVNLDTRGYVFGAENADANLPHYKYVQGVSTGGANIFTIRPGGSDQHQTPMPQPDNEWRNVYMRAKNRYGTTQYIQYAGGYDEFDLNIVPVDMDVSLYVGEYNYRGSTYGVPYKGRLDRFVIRDQSNNGENMYEIIPASLGDDFGFHIRRRDAYSYETFQAVPGLQCYNLNDNITWSPTRLY